MRPSTTFPRLLAGAALAVTMVAACSSGATTTPSPAAPSAAPSAAVSSGGTTVVAVTTSSGAVLAAASNQMTVYTFSKDTANSGKSACSGGCLATWPALTVPAGTTPTASSDITGTLATITRDDGALQVTFNGLPLYFFSKDKAPGDTNGLYTGWNLVTTSGSIISAAPKASAAASPAASAAASAGATGSTVITMTTPSGAVLAAGSNQMTVYTFTKDTANATSSACTGGCAKTWPALTVPSGTQPSAGPGVTGKLGTITRSDDGTIQVTYNGLPLYFFANDKAPGDTNGHYTNWNLVTP